MFSIIESIGVIVSFLTFRSFALGDIIGGIDQIFGAFRQYEYPNNTTYPTKQTPSDPLSDHNTVSCQSPIISYRLIKLLKLFLSYSMIYEIFHDFS